MQATFNAELVGGLPVCRIEFPAEFPQSFMASVAHRVMLDEVPMLHTLAWVRSPEANLDGTVDIVWRFAQLPPLDCPLMLKLSKKAEKGN